MDVVVVLIININLYAGVWLQLYLYLHAPGLVDQEVGSLSAQDPGELGPNLTRLRDYSSPAEDVPGITEKG